MVDDFLIFIFRILVRRTFIMFQKHTLKNGLRIVTVPLENTQTVTVLTMVETGSKYETKETNGLSHFLEHMFFKGTKRRPNTLAIASEIDSIGGEHNAFTAKEYTGYYAKAANKHEEKLLDLIADMYLNSKFEPLEIERERGVIIEEINMRQDIPMVYVSDLFEKLLYEGQPAGWLTIGTKENIRTWQRADFIRYWQKHYLSRNTIIFVAGAIKAPRSLSRVENFFAKINSGKAPQKAKVVERQGKPSLLLHYKKTDQTHFCLGVRAYPIGHPDHYVLNVLGALLGQGMSSRLFIEVREKRGLAYYIKGGADSYTDAGYFVAQAGVPNKKVEEAIGIMLNEYRKLREQKVPAFELKKTKEQLKGRLVLELETSDEIAFWLAGQEVVRRKMLTREEIFKRVDAVSCADLQRVAEDIFTDNKLNLALVGPHKEKAKFLNILSD